MVRLVFISDRNRERYLKIIGPLARFFARIGIHPNVLSVFGFILSIVAGIAYSAGAFFWAAWVVVLAGTFDTLDGVVARATLKNSPFGAFFDSTLDRYSDMFLYIGLAYHFAGGHAFLNIPGSRVNSDPMPLVVITIILAIVGSYMVSYTRARAEGLGIECKKGLMQRPERITLLIIGSLLGAIPKIGTTLMIVVLLILAVSSNLTALYRIFLVRRRILEGNQ
ncbi:MAG: CDP-alcohol phosphatidyltransferase family protein [Deltaproteobacteria bacterium]|nr:CDP-alcohol phosphatidyltransferase family protein [Deltaproteobacteria bacterium]